MPVSIDPRLLPLLFACGRPFSPVYALLMKMRAFFYKRGLIPSQKLPCPVISIGNITMGGTGKTPHVLAMARYLCQKGVRVAIVTRGYGARVKAPPFVVFDGDEIHGSSILCGDEAFMLGESLSRQGIKQALVIVDPDRCRGGRLAWDLGAQVILLDDGFQHMRLYRDLDIVLLRYERPLGNGKVFPGGDLREPLSALKRGQVFVVTGAPFMSDVEKQFKKQAVYNEIGISQDRPIFFSHTRATGLRDWLGRDISIQSLKDMPILAFCGLARPESFYALLKTLGADTKKTISFSDHFAYKEKDVRELLKLADIFKCSHIITTQKDMVKLKALPCTEDYLSRIAWLDVSVEIDTEFWEVVEHYLHLE